MTAPTTARGQAAVPGGWLRRYRPADDAAVRLVCFPHAGGSASAYLRFAAALAPSGVEVLAVQYPGRQDRRGEPFVGTVEELVEAVLPELRQWTHGPFALFGHSLGATVAFETARRLTEGGRTPAHLFLSGRRAPVVPRIDTVHLMDDRALVERVTRLQGTDPTLLEDEELLSMVLPAIRNDYAMAGAYRYRPGPPLSVPTTVLTGDADPNVTPDDARRWSEVVGGPFNLHVLPGGHFFLNDHTAGICSLIEEELGDAH
ncbi:thioesterase II family protein [Streptomyces sp. NPDC057336]|uniref:thioesterase II family protein n=1 Tax=Streptomyces sp. NPDC057336 TaxID=3346102 RepID=UPI003641BCF8